MSVQQCTVSSNTQEHPRRVRHTTAYSGWKEEEPGGHGLFFGVGRTPNISGDGKARYAAVVLAREQSDSGYYYRAIRKQKWVDSLEEARRIARVWSGDGKNEAKTLGKRVTLWAMPPALPDVEEHVPVLERELAASNSSPESSPERTPGIADEAAAADTRLQRPRSVSF